MKTYSNFTLAYHGLLKDVYHTPEFESSPRGMKVRERIGHSFRITNIRDRIPYIPHRKFSISYMIAELVWYITANDYTNWISNYSGFWKNISDNGITANSAYGARIFVPHAYQDVKQYDRFDTDGVATGKSLMPKDWSQWKYVKEELTRDPDSRRAVIHIRMPQDSYLAHKDVPCTLTLQFFIRDGALHQVASMRSSDLILGIAYDIPAFTFFQEMLAFELGVECGTYTHMSNSLHIYERHYEMVENILRDPWVKEFPLRAKPMPPLPSAVPTKVLDASEGAFRSAETENELMADLRSVLANEQETYWKDWLLVLAAHRARKLELHELSKKLINDITFSGFKLFEK